MVDSWAVRVRDGVRARAIFTRPARTPEAEPTVFVLSERSLHQLYGLRSLADPASARMGFGMAISIGPALDLKTRSAASSGALLPFMLDDEDSFWRAVCDAASGLVYLSTKSCLYSLDLEAGNVVALLAGQAGVEASVDGPGADARVDQPFCMLADGRGGLLIKDCGSDRVRLVALPPPGSPPGALSPSVSTLPHVYESNVWAIALDYNDPARERLYVATNTAVYRHDVLPYAPALPPPGAAPAPAPSGSGAAMPPRQPAAAAPGAAAAGQANQPQQQQQQQQQQADSDAEAALERQRRLAPPVLVAGSEDDDDRVDGVAFYPPPAPPPAAAAPLLPGLGAAAAAATSGGATPPPAGAAAFGGPASAPGSAAAAAAAGSAQGLAGGAGGAGGAAAAAAAAGATPVGLGTGGSARFTCITCMAVDDRGRVWVVESQNEDEAGEPHLRLLWPCGLVTTLAARFELRGSEFGLAILPYGWLAVHAWNGDRLQLLRLGLSASLHALPAPGGGGAEGEGGAAAAAAGTPGLPGLYGLAADLGTLLDDPGPTADVVVRVGPTPFSVHRAVLSARCEFFKRLFGGAWNDSGGGEVTLQDADPDAFAQLLRFVYSGTLDFPPHLLRPVAELADRLLLPAAALRAQQLLLAATSPAAVVDDMLWAEGRGFRTLLGGLKAYYLDNAHRVLEEAPGSLETLMNGSPRLHLDLYAAGIKRARRA